ncbi:YfhH family protein [Alkalicoccus urumqiensis]|uniref:DUF1811 domain-containing protein n=1 Tax=Alkalicoccus urumqiensis TaxID=1548213 RepID=A0A2P6MGS8_ALKUR|nr:YfhH family protein [Alkalicoccus urumqiensis]PRO65473.1 DUF1811 domain-containing protein [Alkalicoccus urumqiensis]
MTQQYSSMTKGELEQEIKELRVLAQKAEAKGMINEYAVHERKRVMAEAYLLDPDSFKPKETYVIRDSPGEPFEISYMNGVFAWGYRNGGSKLEAVPISVLGERMD